MTTADPERAMREALEGKWFRPPRAAHDVVSREKRRGYRTWSKEEIAKLAADHNSGKRVPRLAAEFDRTEQSVAFMLRQLAAEGRIRRRPRRFGK